MTFGLPYKFMKNLRLSFINENFMVFFFFQLDIGTIQVGNDFFSQFYQKGNCMQKLIVLTLTFQVTSTPFSSKKKKIKIKRPTLGEKNDYVSKRANSEYLNTYYLRIIIIVEFVKYAFKNFFFKYKRNSQLISCCIYLNIISIIFMYN